MFPLPVRMMMKVRVMVGVVQRVVSAMMSWMMYDEDSKVKGGQVLHDIHEVGRSTFISRDICCDCRRCTSTITRQRSNKSLSVQISSAQGRRH